jgi:cytochrome c peroxidase
MKNLKVTTLLLIFGLVFLLSQCKKDSAIFQSSSSLPIGTPYDLVIPDGFPNPFIPNDNPLTHEGIELGRHIFYDKRLSADNTMSCSSCHLQIAAFTDGLPKSVGIRGLETKRHAMAIFNLAWQENFFWDGRSLSLEDQALLPISDPLELDNDVDTVIARFERDTMYTRLFTAAFGDPSITPDRIAKAISQFERIIVSANSEFDSVIRMGLKPEFSDTRARRGFDMFKSENGDCFHCHGHLETAFQFGAFGRDLQFINNGLKPLDQQANDVGRENVTFDVNDRSKFKVPSVRNAAFSAPFMHDGSIQDLDSLIEFYATGVHITPTTDPNMNKPNGLGNKTWSQSEKDDLKAFMQSLTDFEYLQNPDYSDPFK